MSGHAGARLALAGALGGDDEAVAVIAFLEGAGYEVRPIEEPRLVPAEPWVVKLPAEIVTPHQRWTHITLRAPTLGQMMKASAVAASSNADIKAKLIALITGMDEEAAKQIPAWLTLRIDEYFEAFSVGPPIFPIVGSDGSPIVRDGSQAG